MANGNTEHERRASQTVTSYISPAASAQGSARITALQSRIATVLSTSLSDLEISEALQLLDARGTRNTAETRRKLRLELQEESIESNGHIVQDFRTVAEVRGR